MVIPSEINSPAMQRILAVLGKKNDMSSKDISQEAFVGLTTLACGGYLKAMRTRHLLHVSGWRKTVKGFVTPLFSLGNRADLPRPKFEDHDRNSLGMKHIVDALERCGVLTYIEVAQVTGLSPNTIKNVRYMDILVKQKRVHVVAWRRNRAGPMIAVYAFGPGKAAAKPAPLSHAEICRRNREKHHVLFDDRGLAAQLARV